MSTKIYFLRGTQEITRRNTHIMTYMCERVDRGDTRRQMPVKYDCRDRLNPVWSTREHGQSREKEK
jgi:hypothetical protein